jgi:nitrogen-specific signal transduction histidine kinase
MNTEETARFIEASLKDIQSSPVECLGKILKRICDTLGCYGVILTYHEQTDDLLVDVVHGYQPEDAKTLRGYRLRLGLEPNVSVSTETFIKARDAGAATPLLVPGDDPLTHKITTERMKEVLGYAVGGAGEWAGVLTLESPKEGVLEKVKNSESGRHSLEVFSEVLSMAFLARQSLVFRFNEFIKQKNFRDVETLSRGTLEWVHRKFNVNTCAIFFIEYVEEFRKVGLACKGAIVNRVYDPASRQICQDVGEGYAGWVAEFQHSLILTEVENLESKELINYQDKFKKRPNLVRKLNLGDLSRKIKSYIGVPITDGQETFGVLEVLDAEREYAFSDEGLLEMIARRIAAECKHIFTNIKRESLFEIPKLDTRNLETVIDGIVNTAMKVAAATDAFFMLKDGDDFRPMAVQGQNLGPGDIPATGPGERNLIRWVMEEYREFSSPDLKADRAGKSPPGEVPGDDWDGSFKPKEGDAPVPQAFIPEHVRSLLMVPVYLGSPRGNAADNGVVSQGAEPSAKNVEDIGVLVLMSTKAKAFVDDEVVITALAQMVVYHIVSSRKINEVENKKGEISELRQLMPKYEHATIAAAVTSGTMHTVRNHVDNVKEALDKLLSLDIIHGNPDARELAKQVKKPFDELTSLYDRLFKNVFGDFRVHLEECDIAEQIQEARDYMEPTFRKRGVNFKSFLKEARLPKVMADSILLKVAFINFFKNSIEANARNITVRGRKAVGDDDAAVVELTFEDDGIGIPRESWKTVFKPFVTANKKGGTGLGLAVNVEIINEHGGEVKVVSSVIDGKDHGTMLAVTLPVGD